MFISNFIKGKETKLKKQSPNDVCSKCGKKIKHCKGHFRPLRVLSIVLSLLFLLGFTYWAYSKKSFRSNLDDFSGLKAIYSQRANLPDTGWLEGEYNSPSDVDKETILKIMEHKDQVMDILEKYKDVSPLSKAISSKFPNLYPCIYTPKGSGVLMLEIDSLLYNHRDKGFLALCYISKAYVKNHGHPSNIYYKPSWKAVMITAMDYREPILAGFIFHELGHAYFHSDQKSSSEAPRGSYSYNQEEVLMHDFGSLIYDRATGGRFSDSIDAIVKRCSRYSSYKEVVLGLTLSDFDSLDSSLGCSNMGATLYAMIFPHNCFAVGSAWIEKHFPQQEWDAKKIEMYDWLSQNFYQK